MGPTENPDFVLCDDCKQYANIWWMRGRDNAILTHFDLTNLHVFFKKKACFTVLKLWKASRKLAPGKAGYSGAKRHFEDAAINHPPG
jgi:hypothetical protein